MKEVSLVASCPPLALGGVNMKWRGKGKYPPEQERERVRMLKEAFARRQHESRLQALKDKIDLFGEDSLNPEEKELVRLFHDFFYPEEG